MTAIEWATQNIDKANAIITFFNSHNVGDSIPQPYKGYLIEMLQATGTPLVMINLLNNSDVKIGDAFQNLVAQVLPIVAKFAPPVANVLLDTQKKDQIPLILTSTGLNVPVSSTPSTNTEPNVVGNPFPFKLAVLSPVLLPLMTVSKLEDLRSGNNG